MFTMSVNDLQDYVGHVDSAGMRRIDEAILTSLALDRIVDELSVEKINQMRWNKALEEQPHSKDKEALELTLCPVCASQFYNSPQHYIERINLSQAGKEQCTYCNVRFGWDYRITRKKHRMGRLEVEM